MIDLKQFKGHASGLWMADVRGGCLAVYPISKKNDTNGLHEGDDRNIHYSNKGAHYVDIPKGGYWEMDEEAGADARLIAAAPEMLAELKALYKAVDDITQILIDGVEIDGGHHKQWALEQIAKKLNITLPEHEKGIAP